MQKTKDQYASVAITITSVAGVLGAIVPANKPAAQKKARHLAALGFPVQQC
jgi:hypothetical protein